MQHEQSPDQTAPLAGVDAPVVPSRRAWLARGAVMVTPVIASLASAPVHSATVCVLPSGFISAATFLSRHPGAMNCTRQGPNYWVGAFTTGGWPTAAPDTTTALFSVIFGGTLESGMAGQTLHQVLIGAFTPFAKYCIAAYLNARTSTPGFPLTATQAVAVWLHFRGGPTTTLIPMSWTEATALAWLQTLMDP